MHTPSCWICGNDVVLERCATDEYGLPVHDQCYALKSALATESLRLMARKPPHTAGTRVLPNSRRNAYSSAGD